MTVQKLSRTVPELLELIQKLLDERCEKESFRLKVLSETKPDGEWTYFVVVPASGEVEAWRYAKVVSDVEFDLRFERGEEHLLLVPALTD